LGLYQLRHGRISSVRIMTLTGIGPSTLPSGPVNGFDVHHIEKVILCSTLFRNATLSH
jgi:hypothetical protein